MLRSPGFESFEQALSRWSGITVGVRLAVLCPDCNRKDAGGGISRRGLVLRGQRFNLCYVLRQCMAARRIPLIPPPPHSETSAGVREDERGHEPGASHGKPGPIAYRGKSSGEFQRIGSGVGADVTALVLEAERWIAELTSDDNYRRLLQLAVLRRDAALLTGLLEVIRHRR